MSQGILVFIEHRNGVLNKTSLEAIAAAQSLAAQLQQTVSAVIPGGDVAALAQEIASYDLAKVVTASNAALTDYTPDGYTAAMESVVLARPAARGDASYLPRSRLRAKICRAFCQVPHQRLHTRASQRQHDHVHAANLPR